MRFLRGVAWIWALVLLAMMTLLPVALAYKTGRKSLEEIFEKLQTNEEKRDDFNAQNPIYTS